MFQLWGNSGVPSDFMRNPTIAHTVKRPVPGRRFADHSSSNKLTLDRYGATLGRNYRIGLHLTVVEQTSRQI